MTNDAVKLVLVLLTEAKLALTLPWCTPQDISKIWYQSMASISQSVIIFLITLVHGHQASSRWRRPCLLILPFFFVAFSCTEKWGGKLALAFFTFLSFSCSNGFLDLKRNTSVLHIHSRWIMVKRDHTRPVIFVDPSSISWRLLIRSNTMGILLATDG